MDTTAPHSRSDDSILNPEEQQAVIAKITWRLIPLLFFCYIIAYIDRINVGFAKLHLREVLGVEEALFAEVFGRGAGLFFIGYFFFEVPSNLILHRVGARIWIARIMIFWGLVSMAFMFLNGKTMFYVMRFLLGAAEAGFFPGVILYLTYWYPAKERAKTIALFAVGGVVAGVIGSPISGALLKLDGLAGLKGWQWLFFIEALPAILMGFVVLLILPNKPRQARWLSEREKAWIEQRVTDDAKQSAASGHHRLRDAFTSWQVWLLCLMYFLLNMGGYGFEFWSPSIMKGLSGKGDFIVGLINMIPYAVAAVAMVLVAQHSDKTGERRGHVALSAMSAALGFALAAYSKNPYVAIIGLSIAFAGLKSTLGPFWSLSTASLSGTAAVGGIALINSVGNLGGYFGPSLFGKITGNSGNNLSALLLLGGALLTMGLLALTIRIAKPKRDA